MVTINVKKTTMVKPAEKTPRRSLRLSILDRMNNHPLHNTFVQFYRPRPSASAGDRDGDSDFFAADILRESLSKVLVAFYPMAGRYRGTDDGLGIEIDCNEEGVLFVEAESSSAIDDFGHISLRRQSSGSSCPPLTIQAAFLRIRSCWLRYHLGTCLVEL